MKQLLQFNIMLIGRFRNEGKAEAAPMPFAPDHPMRSDITRKSQG
jgi:hypothetical protein